MIVQPGDVVVADSAGVAVIPRRSLGDVVRVVLGRRQDPAADPARAYGRHEEAFESPGWSPGMSSSAEVLDDAARRHRSIEPFGPSLGRAPYRVQRAVVARRTRRLRSEPIGYKAALIGPATQAALRTDAPAIARLLTADVVPTGLTVALDTLFSPVLAAELVFRVREDLPMHANPEQIAHGCEVTAGLACPDSRYADWFGGEYLALGAGLGEVSVGFT